MWLILLLSACRCGPPTAKSTGWAASVGAGQFGTGIGLVDLDHDPRALPELVLASGNDMTPGPVTASPHTGSNPPYGDAPVPPGAVLRNYGDLCLGDVDSDGDVDVAAIRPWGDAMDLQLGGVDVYLNDGGTLRETPDPDWSIAGTPAGPGLGAFACDFTDIDGDGRLDLGVAVLWDRGGTWGADTILELLLTRDRGQVRIFRNTGSGYDQRTDAWRSASEEGFIDLSFDDIDGDGDLDLTAVGRHVHAWFADDEGLSDAAGLVSKHGFAFPLGLAVARLGEGPLSAVVSSGCQFPVPGIPGCSGVYLVYDLAPSATPVRPRYQSRLIRNPAPIAVADLDADGHPDLLGGSWGFVVAQASTPEETQEKNAGGPLLVFRGEGDAFGRAPCMQSAETLIGQHVAVGAIRPADPVERTTEWTATSGRTLVDLGERALRVVSVTVDGAPATRWAWTPEHTWVSVPATHAGQRVVVEWLSREARDVAVANWRGRPGAGLVRLPPSLDCHQFESASRFVEDADVSLDKDIVPLDTEVQHEALGVSLFPGF